MMQVADRAKKWVDQILLSWMQSILRMDGYFGGAACTDDCFEKLLTIVKCKIRIFCSKYLKVQLD
jgi:hypothetical protein